MIDRLFNYFFSLKALFHFKAFLHFKAFKAFNKKSSKQEISTFCSNLALLLSSGVPLVEALKVIGSPASEQIIGSLGEGKSLAEAMSNYFPPPVISSVEHSVDLAATFGQLARYYDELAEVEARVRAALVYPAFIIILSLTVVAAMAVFVLPLYQSLGRDLGVEQPSISWSWPLAVAGGLLIITLAVAWRGRQRWPERLLKFRFYRREISISFFRLLGALLEGGRPLLPSLQAASSACVSRPARARLEEARVAIENGESFAAALAATSIFGAEAAQLVAVAESSGRLGEMLLNIARYQEKERELFLKKFTSLLEPVLTLVVGLIVGLVALAMFQPLLQIVSRLQ